MRIHADITRCHGMGCTERYTCQRFLELKTGGAHTPFMSTTVDVAVKRPCRERIPALPMSQELPS